MLTKKIFRHFFFASIKKTLILFFFLALTLCFLDYSFHAKQFSSMLKNAPMHFFHYQLCLLSKRLDLLLPTSIFFANVMIMASKRQHNELTALRCFGLSKRQLFSPFLMSSLLLISLLFLNNELGILTAKKKIDALESKYLGIHHTSSTVTGGYLNDGSRLLFLKKNISSQEIQDVYWISHHQEIWHFDSLHLSSGKASGVKRVKKNQDAFQVDRIHQKTIFSPKELSRILTLTEAKNASPFLWIYSVIQSTKSLKHLLRLPAHVYAQLLKPFIILGVLCIAFSLNLSTNRSFSSLRIFAILIPIYFLVYFGFAVSEVVALQHHSTALLPIAFYTFLSLAAGVFTLRYVH